MTFLPIVTRELRVTSRRRGTYWSRASTAALALVGGFVVYLLNLDYAPAEISQALFITLSIGAFIYCLFVGVRSTADCLSEEKREGTLGLLFLTDLRGYDVVGGKLVATSLNAFYGLLAIFPVLAIPLLMGGITNGEFWRMALVLANTFFFSLAVGMFMSSISQSPRRAMAASFIFLLAVSLGLLVAVGTITYIDDSPNLKHVCYLLNPGYPGILVPDMTFKKEAGDFWWSVGVIHASGWLCLGLASVIVPRSWQDRPTGTRMGRWRERWRRWSFGNTTERAAFRRRLLDINAFFWLTARARLKPVLVWAALAVVACFWSWGALENGRSWNDEGVYVVTAIILNSILKLWIASEAGRRLGEDRKLGSLELILSTPLDVREIIRGQLLALRRQFLAPTLAVMFVEFVFLLASLDNFHSHSEEIPGFVAWWVAGNVMLVADMLALTNVAMWVGLSTRNPNRTSGITVIRVLVLPLAVSLGVFIFFGITSAVTSTPFNPDWKFFLALWLLPGMFADLFFGLRARRKLRHEFRKVAAQRYAARPSLWKRLFGPRADASNF
jgi:ABC-type transport system involved in multi-copper enzyme maturation permease subunit